MRLAKRGAFFNSRKEVFGSNRILGAVRIKPFTLVQKPFNRWKDVLSGSSNMVQKVMPLLNKCFVACRLYGLGSLSCLQRDETRPLSREPICQHGGLF